MFCSLRLKLISAIGDVKKHSGNDVIIIILPPPPLPPPHYALAFGLFSFFYENLKLALLCEVL